jgi:hypothetical protein
VATRTFGAQNILGGRPGAAFGPVDDTGADERSSVGVLTTAGEMPERPRAPSVRKT